MPNLRSIPRDLGRYIYRAARNAPALRRLRVDNVSEVGELGDGVENYRVLLPAAEAVSFGPTANERKFLAVSKYFRDGFYSRPEVFVCEIPDAVYHNGTGLVCTDDFTAIGDSQMTYRLKWCKPFNWFRPIRVNRLRGTFATINNTFWTFWWHWLVDCLPRLHCLEQAYPDRRITLLMPEEMGAPWRASLESALPPNFEVRYMPAGAWFKVDRMLLPSYVSTRANGHLPVGYFDFVRRRVFESFGLPATHEPRERIYVSRANAKHRRILNEDALTELLSRYGFRSVRPEDMDFGDQVRLFHDAEAVVSSHGSNCANVMFSGKIKLFVLYPDRVPNTHIFTMAKALGQEHFFLSGRETSENADFSVDLAEVENVLENEMGMTLVAPRK